MLDSPALRDELVRIRTSFAVARAAGLWRSPYPQSAWSELMGCDIRETLEADPGLTVTQHPPLKRTVHAVGFAVSGPCSVWSR